MRVQALRDIAGGYGFCAEGQVINVSASLAKDLEAAGLVKVVGEPEVKEPEADSEEEKAKRVKPHIKAKNAKQDN